MENKLNLYVKLVEDLDCGVAVIPKGTVMEIVKKTDKMVCVCNSLIGVGSFSKNEMELYFEEASELEYNNWLEVTLNNFADDGDDDYGYGY